VLTAGAALRKTLEFAEHKLEVLVQLVEHGTLPCRHSARVLAALQRHEPLTRLAGESTGVLQQRAKLPRIVARGLHPRKDAIVPADDPDVLDHIVQRHGGRPLSSVKLRRVSRRSLKSWRAQ